uniref:phosphoglycolate phosphatase n=1 Tax=Thermodesulfovibrio aggregans TaxID=86166 RepID=A0A7C4AIR9_9BACT
MSVELIIFDLDGTLVDSCLDITVALNHCLEKKGISGFSPEEIKKMVGEGVNRLIEKALQAKKVSFPVNEMIECFINYYRQHIADHSKLYPWVEKTLQELKDFKKVIISNKPTDLTIKTAESFGLLKYFDFIAGSDFFPERKPSPLPIVETIKKFNTTAEKTLIIGDSEIDIEVAKATGVKSVAVSYGYRPLELLKNADFIIDKLIDLINIVREKLK